MTIRRHDGYIHDETDMLPENHPLAYECIACDKCQKMIHASNNEFMDIWVELDDGNFCIECYYKKVKLWKCLGSLKSGWRNKMTIRRHDGYIHDETDMLPENHPLAYECIACDKCQKMIHASNNEFMDIWVELDDGNFCIECYYKKVKQ